MNQLSMLVLLDGGDWLNRIHIVVNEIGLENHILRFYEFLHTRKLHSLQLLAVYFFYAFKRCLWIQFIYGTVSLQRITIEDITGLSTKITQSCLWSLGMENWSFSQRRQNFFRTKYSASRSLMTTYPVWRTSEVEMTSPLHQLQQRRFESILTNIAVADVPPI